MLTGCQEEANVEGNTSEKNLSDRDVGIAATGPNHDGALRGDQGVGH